MSLPSENDLHGKIRAAKFVIQEWGSRFRAYCKCPSYRPGIVLCHLPPPSVVTVKHPSKQGGQGSRVSEQAGWQPLSAAPAPALIVSPGRPGCLAGSWSPLTV